MRVSTLAFAVLSGLALACSKGAAPVAVQPPPRPVRSGPLSPERLLLLPEPSAVSFSEQDRDGTRRAIAQGLRLLERPAGGVAHARQLLPTAHPLSTLSLPARLGGGFLFYSVDEEATNVWRADAWTGSLSPLARLPFAAGALVAGFDRVYAVSRRTSGVVALDPRTGQPVGPGSLPPAPAYGSLAFADEWMGAVETDVRGVLVTFDAGASYRPLDLPVTLPAVTLESGEIVLATVRGRFALEPDGTLRPLDGNESDAEVTDGAMEGDGGATDVHDVLPAPGPLGARPLQRAALRGYPVSREEAIVLDQGVLAVVDLRTGEVRDQSSQNADALACQGMRVGRGVGFACARADGGTAVYEYAPPLGVRPVLSFQEPRYVASSGNGALVVRGSCTSGSSAKGAYCLRTPEGAKREIRVRGDVGAERVVTLSDGRAVVLVPPRLGAPGAMTIIGLDNRSTTRALDLAKATSRSRELLSRGQWMDGMVEGPKGTIHGWVVGASSFAGVVVHPDGTVRAGPMQREIGTAHLSGLFGLIVGDSGVLRETVDGGTSFHDLTLPISIGESLGAAATPSEERGCSPVGCAFGSWVKVGWGTRVSTMLEAAPQPKPVTGDRAVYVSWSFDCAATGEASPVVLGRAARALPAPPGSRTPRPVHRVAADPIGEGEVVAGAFRPFLGIAAPAHSPSDMVLDFGTEDHTVQARGYAWGPRGARWDAAGRWLVRALDRFEVKPAIWSTAVSRAPWADAREAAPLFGGDPSHRSISEWNVLLDPAGGGGLLITRTTSETAIFSIQKERPIQRILDPEQLGFESATSVVKVGEAWYAGAPVNPRLFRVLRFGAMGAESNVTLVGSYPRQGDGMIQVVRSARGDALGILSVARGRFGARGGGDTWYVHPVDLESGRAGAPIVVPRERLSSAPPACDADDDGWVVVHAVSPSVTNVDFDTNLKAERLEARLLVGPSSVCAEALHAQVAEGPVRDLARATASQAVRSSIPMSLSDRAADRRYGFRCVP